MFRESRGSAFDAAKSKHGINKFNFKFHGCFTLDSVHYTGSKFEENFRFSLTSRNYLYGFNDVSAVNGEVKFSSSFVPSQLTSRQLSY